jgi:hypothetical protein
MADLPEEPPEHQPYYETRHVVTPVVASARTLLARELRRAGLELVLRRTDGTEERIGARDRRISDPVAMIGAAVLLSTDPGAEVDSVVASTGEDLLLATFWWETDRLVVQQGHQRGILLREGPDEAELRERFGTMGKLVEVDRPWDPLARGLVESALDSMTPAERELIQYIAMHRVRAQFDGGSAAAVYVSERGEPRIELFDYAVSDHPSFVGDPADPRPFALLVVVHELGHGLMFAPKRIGRILHDEIEGKIEVDRATAEVVVREPPSPARDHRLEELEARLSVRRAAAEAVEDWLGSDPVLDAWTVAVGDEPAPTRYGRTRGREGFAEAFALWHVDRAALERVAPRAAAFFGAGGHVKAAEDSIAQVQALASPGL